MPTILIDGNPYEVAEGRNVLQAALDHKLDLPYFCWHPAMGSVGACRLCAVKHYRDENDEHGRLAMGCMTPATEGTRVAIDEPEAAQFRRSVIEWLMINHPHDCPVCDEGGECHLQDMTVMTGHAHRRYRGRKRTYRNQYLGPLIHHEMNRCIQCYRCVRFYVDHSGGHDLGVFASRDRVYFGRVEEGALESPFSGNLVEVCPTGVFTDKTYRRHYARKWDLQSAPSICGHCGLGCNTLVGARYGSVRRVANRYNSEVNGYWLCDRGRFGYEHVNADDRLLKPQTPRRDGDELSVSAGRVWDEAIAAIRVTAATGKLAAVGSPRASLESNFALLTLVGAERFCTGIAEPERRLVGRFAHAARAGAFHVPTLQEIEGCDVILVLGADLTHEAPLLDLALFRAHAAAGAAIHLVGLRAGRVGEFAASFESGDPGSIATRGRAVAAGLRADGGEDPVAAVLAAAHCPLVITGTQHRDAEVLEASLAIVEALRARNGTHPWFAMSVSEANTLGVELLDDRRGMSLASVIDAIEVGDISVLVVAENDLFERCEDHRRLADALQRLDALVVLDHMVTATSSLATHAFPAATIPESSGTLVNSEGRIQRFCQVLRPAEDVVPSWSATRDIIAAIGRAEDADWQHLEDVTAAIEASHPAFDGATKLAPALGFQLEHQPISRVGHRYSGRNATIRPDAPDEPDALTEVGGLGPDGALPVAPRTPGWNSNEAINRFRIEVDGPLRGDNPGLRIFATNGNGAHPAPSPLDPGRSPAAATPSALDTPRSTAAATPSGDDDTVLVCAAAEIFGSESMSRRGPALAELAPDTYLRLHPKRAERLGVVEGRAYRLRLIGETFETSLEAVVKVDDELPDNVAVIPAGYAETRWWQQPTWMRLESVEVEP
ncbi:MAG: NADH-quinone oxidoreductase subunit NuoG [Acidobacteria bacterium]|nr:NADH-quinone oxidoreductase subunit NuoG [Acidobacteriota bacterium]